MFSLIITIISIALVAALALATLYYGGNAFLRGSSDAYATRLLNQGQQILGAAELYRADNGSWPQSMQALVDGNYLREIPTVSAQAAPGLMATVQAAMAPATPDAWTMPEPGVPVFTLTTGVDVGSCRAVNKKTTGKDGILPKAHSVYLAQCYSPSDSVYKVVVTKDGERAVTALGAEGTTEMPPQTDDDPKWVVKPNAASPAGQANGNGNGSNGVDINGNPLPAGTSIPADLIWAGDPLPLTAYFDSLQFFVELDLKPNATGTVGLRGVTASLGNATASLQALDCAADGSFCSAEVVLTKPTGVTPGTTITGSLTFATDKGNVTVPIEYYEEPAPTVTSRLDGKPFQVAQSQPNGEECSPTSISVPAGTLVIEDNFGGCGNGTDVPGFDARPGQGNDEISSEPGTILTVVSASSSSNGGAPVAAVTECSANTCSIGLRGLQPGTTVITYVLRVDGGQPYTYTFTRNTVQEDVLY